MPMPTVDEISASAEKRAAMVEKLMAFIDSHPEKESWGTILLEAAAISTIKEMGPMSNPADLNMAAISLSLMAASLKGIAQRTDALFAKAPAFPTTYLDAANIVYTYMRQRMAARHGQ